MTTQRERATVLGAHMMTATALVMKINDQRNRIAGGYEIPSDEPGPINMIAAALADAERRGIGLLVHAVSSNHGYKPESCSSCGEIRVALQEQLQS